MKCLGYRGIASFEMYTVLLTSSGGNGNSSYMFFTLNSFDAAGIERIKRINIEGMYIE